MSPQSLVSPMERLRVNRGLSMSEASRLIGIDRRSLFAYEQEGREPFGPALDKLSTFYGIAPADLLELIREATGGRRRRAA
jgi:transcriptional regulator with XRE-family HTH domain